ncbi:MAG: alpha-ketoglutarate-dependent dioxygenase AlkB family protein [Propionibacteriaceae bacterium]
MSYHPGWVPDATALLDRLVPILPWERHDITIFGRTVPTPRLTCWLGDAPYTYSGVVNHPHPLPPELARLGDRLSVLTGVGLNSCLANLYRDGNDSMGYHSDDEPELGDRPTIASISLGSRRTFHLRHQVSRERWSWPLGEGDLLVMRDESQADYRHAVPKTTRALGPRLNLTFRRFDVPSARPAR